MAATAVTDYVYAVRGIAVRIPVVPPAINSDYLLFEECSGNELRMKLAKSNIIHPNLKAGDNLQLQFVDNPDKGRYSVKVIGYLPEYSLMITAPRVDGNIILLREGKQFVARLLSGKQVYGFTSEVIKVYLNPFPYVHLTPPHMAEQYDIRNAYRVKVGLIASIRCAGDAGGSTRCTKIESVPGMIVDMSTTGCRIKVPRPMENVNVIVTAKIKVANQERVLSLNSQVRSCKEAPEGEREPHHYLCGVEFNPVAEDKQLLLHCYVYEQLVGDIYTS